MVALVGLCFLVLPVWGCSSGATCPTGTNLVDGHCVVSSNNASGGGAGSSLDASAVDDGAAIANSCPEAPPPFNAIFDDFEVGSASRWFTYSDKTGTVDPPAFMAVVGGAPGSTTGLKFTGSGFMPGSTNFGAGTGEFSLCTDVSGYQGLTFWARGNTAATMQLETPRTKPVANDGECPDTARCFDLPAHQFTVSDTWKQYAVDWSQFYQAGWGYRDDFQKRKIINGLQFTAIGAKDAPGGAFELDLDDIGYAKTLADGGSGL